MSLSNVQYDAIIRKYNQKQLQNQHILELRIQEVYERDERLSLLDKEISAFSIRQAKRLIEGNEKALIELKEQLHSLIQQKQSVMKELGYPEDYLELPVTCKDCKDTGYIQNKKCHCFLQASIDMLYTQSHIRNILERENFSKFSYAYYSDGHINPATGMTSLQTIQLAVKECKKFVECFDEGFDNIFMYGDTGIGKTFLSNCIAKELLDKGKSVIYVTAFQLFEIFAKSTFEKDTQAVDENRHIFECDLLIIDDLGTELSNSFTTSQVFLCLNERILRQKSTIISTNLNIGQLSEGYSERTFSRISSHYTMIKLFGDDIRIQKKLKGF